MKKMIDVKMILKIKCPSVPNFILLDPSETPISIKEFNDSELKQIGDMWTKELIKKAKNISSGKT